MIHGDDSLKLSHISGFSDHCNITVTGRLLGGKPVKVKMMTNHLPCGSHVTIDIEEDASKDEIKMKLAEATGVPVEHQKVMLSGINQIVMGDKRWVLVYTIQMCLVFAFTWLILLAEPILDTVVVVIRTACSLL